MTKQGLKVTTGQSMWEACSRHSMPPCVSEVEELAEPGWRWKSQQNLGLLLVCSLASCVALGSPASLSGNDVVNGLQYAVSYRVLVSFATCSFKNEAFLTKYSHIFKFSI